MSNYGTIEDGDTYFETRLNSASWTDANDTDKLSALVMATQHIEQLNFIWAKSEADQALQFPRSMTAYDDTVTVLETPDEIDIACYEEALAILDGRDLEKEVDSLMLRHTSLGKISYDLDVSFVPVHLMNGILSSLAWQYLKPFLRDPRSVTTSRVN
jgi:hypothetical protein